MAATTRPWRDQAVRLAVRFSQARGSDESELLQSLHTLLLDAPAPVRSAIGTPCDATIVARWIDHAAPGQVAIELVGRAGYMLSRSAAGRVMATVVAADLFDEQQSAADSEGLALGAALSRGLAEWAAASIYERPASLAQH